MFPGMNNISPKKMEKMMKQMGINMTELDDVESVLIRTSTSEIEISSPAVTVMEVKGQKTFQVVGIPHERVLTPSPSEDDVKLVMEQANVSREEALEALEKSGGDLAEAIISLTK